MSRRKAKHAVLIRLSVRIHDPSVFPDPEVYDATRPNLIPDAAGRC